MRLIDADKIDFGKVFIGASDFAKDTREAAQKLIDEQPTAYDVGKVLSKLEEAAQDTDDYLKTRVILSESFFYDGKVSGLDIAIAIVKSGGIE